MRFIIGLSLLFIAYAVGVFIYSAIRAGYIHPWQWIYFIVVNNWMWLVSLGAGLALIIIAVLISPLLTLDQRRWCRRLAIAGVVFLGISVIIFTSGMIVPSLLKKPTEYTFVPCKEIDWSNFLEVLTCSLFGYRPAKAEDFQSPSAKFGFEWAGKGPPRISVETQVNATALFIATILLPFIFFWRLYDGALSDIFIGWRRGTTTLISFIGAYATLRGFMELGIINFFYYGWLGIGFEYFSMIIVLMIWWGVNKLFKATIEYEAVKDFWDVITGKKHVALSQFLEMLANLADPAGFIVTQKDKIKNYIETTFGATEVANEIEKLATDLRRMRPHDPRKKTLTIERLKALAKSVK